jgi:hypothetical protein
MHFKTKARLIEYIKSETKEARLTYPNSEIVIDFLLDNLPDIEKFEEVFKKKRDDIYEDWWQHLDLLDLQIFLHVHLYLFLSQYIDDQLKKNCQIDDYSNSFRAIIHFSLILSNLSNYLFSIKMLLISGYDLAAKTLLRSYMEYSDVGVCLLANEEFLPIFEAGTSLNEDEMVQYWYKHFRPQKLTQKLKMVYLTLEPSGKIWDIISKLRNDNYRYLSAFVHAGQCLTNFVSALDNAHNEKAYRSTFGGTSTKLLSNTIHNLNDYSLIFLRTIVKSIVNHHNIKFKYFGDDGYSYAIILKIAERIQIENMIAEENDKPFSAD